MSRLIILTDAYSEFLVSRADLRYFTSMDVDLISNWFRSRNYDVKVCKFSELDLNTSYKGVFFLYQTSEAPGAFYKRYIEDLVYHLEKLGAIPMPSHEYLKAHHDKVFMEFIRMRFQDESLKTIRSTCYGSWVDARSYSGNYPVVIKQASGSAGKGVYLARNPKEYQQKVKKAGRVVIGSGLADMVVTWVKNTAKKFVKWMQPDKKSYVKYNTAPVSSAVIVQNYIPGLSGDYKVLYFGRRYYFMYRKNRPNDFRASGSGQFLDVPEEEQLGVLEFARKVTHEINFPIIGMDIGFDGENYHLIEFQMIHLGTSALQRSRFWHEYHEGSWIKVEGNSILEEELARSIDSFINQNYSNG